MTDTTELSASMGDYIKVIHQLSRERGTVHAGDVAKALNVSKPSVTGALRMLAARELISYAPYSPITLTSKGASIAREIETRFDVLRDFLERVLRLDPHLAEETSHELEHCLPSKVFGRLTAFIEYVERCPMQTFEWSEHMGFVCTREGRSLTCENCQESCGKTW